jgi:hypothetical protein
MSDLPGAEERVGVVVDVPTDTRRAIWQMEQIAGEGPVVQTTPDPATGSSSTHRIESAGAVVPEGAPGSRPAL